MLDWLFRNRWLEALERRVSDLEAKCDSLLKGVIQMGLDFTQLQAAIAKETTVVQSTVTLLQALSAEITSLAATQTNPQDQASLNTFATQLNAQIDTLSQAVVANTPAAPTPPAP